MTLKLNDPKQILRSPQYSILNMALTVQDRHIFRPTVDNYTVSQKKPDHHN